MEESEKTTRQYVLEQLQTEVRRAADDPQGTTCPVCNRHVQVYRRKMHSEMALFLIKLVQAYTDDPRWYKTIELIRGDRHLRAGGTDGGFLKYWGLVERSDGTNRAGGKAGTYRPTAKGIRFAHNNEYVPTHVHLLNKEVVGWAYNQTNIRMVLGNKFDYAELMRGY